MNYPNYPQHQYTGFDQYPEQPAEHIPQHRLEKSKKWPWVAGIAAFLVAMALAVGVTLLLTQDKDQGGGTTNPPAAEEPFQPVIPDTTAELPPELPTAKDFDLTLKTRSKQCFGYGMGCHVELSVDLAYNGATDLTEYEEVTVTYEITGGDAGPVTASLTIYGYQWPKYDQMTQLLMTNDPDSLAVSVVDVSGV